MSDDRGHSYYDGGGYGRNPSVTTRVDESKEAHSIITDMRLLWLISMGMIIIVYALINVSVKLPGVQVLSVIFCVSIGTSVAYFGNKIALRFWPTVLIHVKDGATHRTRFIFRTKYLFALIGVALVVGLIAIVPDYFVFVFVFPAGEEARVVAVRLGMFLAISACISGLVAMSPTAYRLIWEIVDRHHAALELRKNLDNIAWEREQILMRAQHPEWFPTAKSSKSIINQSSLPNHLDETPFILVNTSARQLTRVPSQRDEPREFWRIMIEEFVRGIDKGRWTTAETSWPGKTIPGTKFRVSSIAPSVRAGLISAGLAAWRHPSDQRQGWDLLESPQEIIDRRLSVEEIIYEEKDDDNAYGG